MSASIYPYQPHVITCVFSNILEEVTGVTWSLVDEPDLVTSASESYNSDENTQRFALIISGTKLEILSESGSVTTITCSATFGTMMVSAQQELSVYVAGTNKVFIFVNASVICKRFHIFNVSWPKSSHENVKLHPRKKTVELIVGPFRSLEGLVILD